MRRIEVLNQIVPMLSERPITAQAITDALGRKSRRQVTGMLGDLCDEGRAFRFGSGAMPLAYFSTEAARDAYAAVQMRGVDLELRRRHTEATERFRRSQGIKPREPKPQKQRQRPDASATIKRLKAETKAAGILIERKGTKNAKAPRPAGPARIAGEPDISKARITRDPRPRDRFAVDSAPQVVTSSECRPWARGVIA